MTDRERNLVILLGIVLAGGALWYFLLPLWHDYWTLGERVRDNVLRIRRARRKISRLGALEEDTRRMRDRFRRSRRKFPVHGEFYALMARLEEQARAAGLPEKKIVAFERTGSRDRRFVRKRIVRARFRELRLEQVARLLWRFRTRIPRLRVMSFDRFTLEAVPRRESPRFNVSFDLVVYTLKSSSPGVEVSD